MGCKIEQIEELKRVLSALPKLRAKPARPKTIDALRLLKNDIDQMQHKGYGLDAIAAILGQHGLRMSGKTLRNYLAKIRAEPPHVTGKASLPPAAELHHQTVEAPFSLPGPVTAGARTVPIKAAIDSPRKTGAFALHPDTDL